MPDDVRQRLLRDPVHAGVHVHRQRAPAAFHLVGHPELVAGHPVDERRDGVDPRAGPRRARVAAGWIWVTTRMTVADTSPIAVTRQSQFTASEYAAIVTTKNTGPYGYPSARNSPTTADAPTSASRGHRRRIGSVANAAAMS